MYSEDYEKQVFIGKIEDKIRLCKKNNSIEYTDFLDVNKKSIVLDVLKKNKFSNYIINNSEDEFEKNIIILYPEKYGKQIAIEFYNKIVQVIKIENPRQLNYEHRVYLSGLMKLGIKREKIGDIFVFENGASIIVFQELASYISLELKELKRFNKSKISIENIKQLEKKEIEFENTNIIVSSLRLDSLVSSLAKCSRTKSKEIIELGKVFVNGKNETKISKLVNQNDIINIRGKGKFILEKVESKTRKENLRVSLKKYI